MGIFKDYKEFGKIVFSYVWGRTWSFFVKNLAIEIPISIITTIVTFFFTPLDFTVDWLYVILIPILSVLLMFIVIGIVNLFTTPYLIWRDQKNILEPLQKKNLDVCKLKEIYEKGEKLARIKSDTLDEDRRSIRNWFDESEKIVEEMTNSGFGYKKSISKPSPNAGTEKLQRIHNKKLEKLQKIIIELEQ